MNLLPNPLGKVQCKNRKKRKINMKELSIEQKAKAYDEALERAREWHNDPHITIGLKGNLEDIFPELKESEDERMKKSLIHLVHLYGGEFGMIDANTSVEKAIAWLEKQGETSTILSNSSKIGNVTLSEEEQNRFAKCVLTSCASSFIDYLDAHKYEGKMCVSNGECEDIENAFHNAMWDRLHRYYCKYIEKQGEQKPADKVEPKFHEGDWVVTSYGKVNQVIAVDEDCDGFTLDDDTYFSGSWKDGYHLWTIQDAKDGDVLCYKDEISLYKHDIKNCTKQETTFGGFVYHCCYDGKRFIMDSLYSLTEQDKTDIHPATKSQRDLLFAKMKEAGYEWDDANKVLIAVKPKSSKFNIGDVIKFNGKCQPREYTITKVCWPTHYVNDYGDIMEMSYTDANFICVSNNTENKKQNKLVWSEEDMFKVQRICKYLDEAKKYYADITEVRECIDWLKSLRHQKQWKPSEEQIKTCKEVYADILSAKGFDLGTVNNELNRLEEQLKKLTE